MQVMSLLFCSWGGVSSAMSECMKTLKDNVDTSTVV